MQVLESLGSLGLMRVLMHVGRQRKGGMTTRRCGYFSMLTSKPNPGVGWLGQGPAAGSLRSERCSDGTTLQLKNFPGYFTNMVEAGLDATLIQLCS